MLLLKFDLQRLYFFSHILKPGLQIKYTLLILLQLLKGVRFSRLQVLYLILMLLLYIFLELALLLVQLLLNLLIVVLYGLFVFIGVVE